MTSLKTVLLLGSSGETGKVLLKELQTNSAVGKIILVGRRKLDLDNQDGKVSSKKSWVFGQ